MNRLRGHKGDVCATTACQGLIASAGHDKTICVWDPSLPNVPGADTGPTSTSQLVHKHRSAHDHIISCLETYHGPSFPQPLLISGSWDGMVRVWDFTYQKGRDKKTAPFDNTATATAESATGTDTVVAASIGTEFVGLPVLPAAEGRGGLLLTLLGHTHRVKALSALSNHMPSDPPRLVSGSDDFSVRALLGSLTCPALLFCVLYRASLTSFLSPSLLTQVRVWSLSSGACLLALEELHSGFVQDVAVCPTRHCLHLAAARTEELPVAALGAAAGVGAVAVAESENVTPAVFEPSNPHDLALVASCSANRELKVRSIDGAALWETRSGCDMTAIIFCFDAMSKTRLMCCGDVIGSITIYTIREATAEVPLEATMQRTFSAHAAAVTALTLSSTATYPLLLSVGKDGWLHSWDLIKQTAGSVNLDCSKEGPATKQAQDVLCCDTMYSTYTATTAATADTAEGDVQVRAEALVLCGTNGMLLVATLTTLIPRTGTGAATDEILGKGAGLEPMAGVVDSETPVRLPPIFAAPIFSKSPEPLLAGEVGDAFEASVSNVDPLPELPEIASAATSRREAGSSDSAGNGAATATATAPSSDTGVSAGSHERGGIGIGAGGHKATLLQSMLMEGGSEVFSLGYGRDEEGGAGGGGRGSGSSCSPGAGTGNADSFAQGTDTDKGNTKSAATSLVNMSSGIAITRPGPTGTGNRGILNSPKRAAGQTGPRTIPLTSRRERELKQAKTTPAYCLLEPEGQSSAFWKKANNDQNMMRVRLDVRAQPPKATLSTQQQLLRELQSTYSGENSAVDKGSAAAGGGGEGGRRLVASNSMPGVQPLRRP